ncbi:MAG: DEAD-box ATP-dependent RNA helicase CshA [Chlamydiales bacterium]|nr:DEAD-box ATP-dependent RNA helicase CshA [Chlamydiales bacterium]MCH9619949.1 DEAD-box ATP-dependent RNA helicase CshA [Chlamydiales bacterium]MCH9622624.1 DEAD-box ATP-dependent RNA helicase CshA [Chlamydiales bacterium]
MTFDTYSLDPDVLTALDKMGYTSPTPIQEKTLSYILEKKDLIALAETGSGKTAACAIPVCSRVSIDSKEIQALVVVPTRELALQYATEVQKIGKVKQVSAFALFGGEDMDLQLAKLKAGVQVLIATPGRLIDLIYRQAIDLNHVKTLILDEADQMLSLGFYEDLDFIMDCLVQEHQTLLFSATMPPSIKKIAQGHMKTPEEITLISKRKTPTTLSLEFVYCKNPHAKKEELLYILRNIKSEQCLIFANARHEVEKLYHHLKPHFHPIDFLHGGLAQKTRTSIIGKFARGKTRYLVASDVASRGLDFSAVSHVINMHFPRDQDTYLHRAGRTGRIGAAGVCITLVTKRELTPLDKLMKTIKREPKWIGLPPQR